ncbi:MAG: translocation/assembly module TamB domain-containing protein, partial [Bacteroidales bacterium]|nr:translocation/assembly module TamB domain-containing protein [Bacteroidales bacterium]
ASVAAVGNGNLQLSIASGSPFSLSGDYIIQSGSFKIDLMDLISRELTLENGSSLSWSGSPTDANIDIKGVYSQRVNLASLYSASSSMEQTTKTVNVESIIALSGQLLNPTIKFDFRLPNADQSTEEEVFAIIDRTNEREMINQTMSLLAFSQFYSSTSSTIGSFNGISSGLDIMANQVSSVVSSMVEFVDVNINYKSGDELVTDQLDIDISKEWNRFYFETTFGIGGDARTLNQLDDGSASTIIGDVLLGYKISPNFHLIAFNRSNANDYTKQDMPYTQGVGIKYSKDFDTWKSLFTRRRKAKNTEPSAKRK